MEYITDAGSNLAPWDVSEDGLVDMLDTILVATVFGSSGEELAADVTGDGVVNILDLVLVASHFGQEIAQMARAASGLVDN